jgi:CDP-diacylglycerol---serine O-phosphatidyltransferase
MRHIPNFLTLSNLFLGCCALVFTLVGDPMAAAWCTLGCFLCDYSDGMAARALGVSAPLGKELDSLADVVSFGVVPGAMLYTLLLKGLPADATAVVRPEALPAFVLSAFSGLRLARFNLDTRQTNYFLGLSTPACTVLVLGLTLAAHHDRFGLGQVFENQWFLYALVGGLSWLLNSEIPMFGLKIKGLGWRKNAPLLLFAGLFVVLIAGLRELGLAAVIVCYVGLSVLMRRSVLGDAGA